MDSAYYTHASAHPQAVTGTGWYYYCYDANGNRTQGGAYVWDVENRLASLWAGGVTFTYDGNGARVKKTEWFGTAACFLDLKE